MNSATAREPRKVYTERFIFMAALLIPAAFLMGFRVLLVSALSVALCMITDKICCCIRKVRYDIKDSAVLFWGLSAAMLMPVSVGIVQIVLSSVIIVVLGKHLFGSTENIIFPPSAIAAAFLIICYPAQMLYYPKVGEIYPVFGEFGGTLTRSLDYTLRLGLVPTASVMDILMGSVPGAIGAVNIMIILVCGICLLIRRSNSLSAVLPCLLTVGVLAFLYPRAEVSGLMSVFYELSSGYLLFGIMFMSAEPAILPKRITARVIYGVVLGYTVMMFRNFGKTEGSFVFALLIVSALACCFDTLVENLEYWRKTYLNSYEQNKSEVQHGKVKLTDTQEIVLPEKYRYNTPPVDGEVKKHRRKRKEDIDGEE